MSDFHVENFTTAELAQTFARIIPAEKFVVVGGAAVLAYQALIEKIPDDHDLDIAVAPETYDMLAARPGWKRATGAAFTEVLRCGRFDIGTSYGPFHSFDDVAQDAIAINGISYIHPWLLYNAKRMSEPSRGHDRYDAELLTKYTLPRFSDTASLAVRERATRLAEQYELCG